MSDAVLWLLLFSALGVIGMRRRSVAILLTAAQSLLLGGEALGMAGSSSSGLLVAGALLVIKGIALPAVLWWAMRRTRERRALASEPRAAVRLLLALAPAVAVALLTPSLGLRSHALQDTALALVVLGIASAGVRRATAFQVLGFLIAENGIYLAALGAGGGLPPVIDLGLACDLVLTVGVAGAFGTRIHRTFGTTDTSLLGSLRD